ncbi:toxin transporter [Proteus mirabilis]|nr:toxin transporter [Proteus mirabilis]
MPLTIIPLVIIVGLLAQIPLSKYINESMKESSQRQGLAVEAIEGIETLKTNNAMNWAQKRWDYYTAKTASSSMKVKNISNFVIYFAVMMQQLNTIFLVIIGTYLIHSDDPASKITMGALIATVILSGRALSPLGQIAG